MKTRIWTDPIVDEIREIREKLAREASYDVRILGAKLQKSEKRHGRKLATRQPRKLNSKP